MKIATLNLIAHHTDNGDGSTSVHLFNDREELKKDLEENGNYFSVEDIERGDDPYGYGTLSEYSIDLEIDPNTGLAKLPQPITLTSDC
jgi:hypothetical protein